MAERATAAGYPISHVQLGKYAREGADTMPSEKTRRAIAAALGVDPEEVKAAVWASIAPEQPDGVRAQHAQAFMRLTEGRTEEEIRKTLAVVEVVLGIPPRQEPAGGAPESSVEGPSRE